MDESETSPAEPNPEYRRIRFSFRTLLGFVTISAVLCGLLLALRFGCSLLFRPSPMSVQEAKEMFTENTGIAWPDEASNIQFNKRGHVLGPCGEFYVTFSLPPEVLRKWLPSEAPWLKKAWLRGPVPPTIGAICSFGYDDISCHSTDNVNYEYDGNSEILPVLKSDGVLYSARSRSVDP